MNNIISFENSDEFRKFFYEKTVNLFYLLGSGSEGCAYLGLDGYVYKYLSSGLAINIMPKSSDIITANDYELDSFAFPIELYTLNDKVIGYKSKYIKNDLFKEPNFNKIDFDILLDSYYKMLKDIKIISNDNIYMFDFIGNLVFNNQNLVGIDTTAYFKKDDNTYNLNKLILELSIKKVFSNWGYKEELPTDSFETYIRKLQKLR